MPWSCTSAKIENCSPCAGRRKAPAQGVGVIRNVGPRNAPPPKPGADDFDVETPVENNPAVVPPRGVNPPSRPQPRGHFVQLSTPTAFTPQPLGSMLDGEMPTKVG